DAQDPATQRVGIGLEHRGAHQLLGHDRNLSNTTCATLVAQLFLRVYRQAMTSLWRNRRYATWLVSDTAKGLSNALVGFAIPLLPLVVTDDPRQAGVVGAIGLAVRVALMLYGGVLADRHRRVTLMLLGAGVGAVIAAGFTVLAGLD